MHGLLNGVAFDFWVQGGWRAVAGAHFQHQRDLPSIRPPCSASTSAVVLQTGITSVNVMSLHALSTCTHAGSGGCSSVSWISRWARIHLDSAVSTGRLIVIDGREG